MSHFHFGHPHVKLRISLLLSRKNKSERNEQLERYNDCLCQIGVMRNFNYKSKAC